jgi:hypothetical protein
MPVKYYRTMKKIIILFTAICMLTGCKPTTENVDETYGLWAEMSQSLVDGTGNNSLYVNTELIKSLSAPAKKIIARYSVFMPDYYSEECNSLAQALGNFSTLEEAQQILLKDWDCDEIIFNDNEVSNLQLRKTEQSLYFTYNAIGDESYTTHFYIEDDGTILCLVTKKIVQFNLYDRLIKNENEDNEKDIYTSD